MVKVGEDPHLRYLGLLLQADATGANLYSIPDRRWNPDLLAAICDGGDASNDVERMMGQVERDPRKSAGSIGKWYQERYGFTSGEFQIRLSGLNDSKGRNGHVSNRL